MRKFLLLQFLTLTFPAFIFSQTIPDDDIEPICDGQSITTGAPDNSGINNITLPCNEFQPLSPYLDFYYIRILSGTTFTFTLNPVGNDDYDFAAYLNPNWADIGATPTQNIRGSQNDPNQTGIFHLGLSLTATDTCETGGSTGNPEPGMVKFFSVQPDDEILIVIDRWSSTTQGYTISFGGDAVLDCTVVGDSYGKCDVDQNQIETFNLSDFLPDLTNDFPGDVYEFYETQTEAESGSGTQVSFPYDVNFADNPSELFVRIETSSGGFVRVIQIFLYVNPIPQITSPVNLELCDADGNGLENFDLTTAESDLVANPSFYNFLFYDNLTDAQNGAGNNINPATSYPSGTATVYARVESGALEGNEDGCFTIGEIHLEVTDEIEPEFQLENAYCLGSNIPELEAISSNGIQGTWNPVVIDDTSPNNTTYTFTPNPGQCADEFQIEIEITDQIIPMFDLETSYCENSEVPQLPNISTNGISGSWDVTEIDNSAPNTTTYTFTPNDGQCAASYEIEIEIIEGIIPEFDLNNSYCIGEEPDILPETSDNGIQGTWSSSSIDTSTPGISSYTFTPDSNDCTQEFEIEIEVFDAVQLNQNLNFELCDDDFDGIYETGLTDLNSDLISNPNGLTFSYYSSQTNLDNDISIPQNQWNNYEFTALPASIFVIATNQNGCRSEESEVEFTMGTEVSHNGNEFGPIEFCQNETIDLTTFEPTINPGSNYSYFETEANAQSQDNEIVSPEAYVADSDNGTVYVRLDEPGKCAVILPISYERKAIPSLDGLPDSEALCDGDSLEITASSDDPDAVIQWTTESGDVFTGATQTLTETGSYSVVAIGSNGCESEPRIFTITLPESPVITGIESGNDYITVNASNSGNGPMEYSLDGILWQDSNQFNNLIKGQEYTIYVRSAGCMVSSYKMTLIDVPNFVSPNGDGYNDVWAIRGINADSGSTIKIFDRSGKVFVDTDFQGNYLWDGKYGGRPVPSDDYWYIVEVPSDGIVVAQRFVGHISIRNQ
jgi:gliding motility-associated-like protein